MTGLDVLLVLVLIMPKDKADVMHQEKMDTVQECLDEATRFMSKDPKAIGAVGLLASCKFIDNAERS